jgi:glutamate dehydrogenase
LAYTKIDLFAHLLETDVDRDPSLTEDLVRYFPPRIAEVLGDSVARHRLRGEIIATSAANSLINRTGPGFVHRTAEEADASPAEVARAYAVARSVFDLREFWGAIEALDGQVPPALQIEMFIESQRLVERGTVWFLRNTVRPIDIAASIEAFGPGVAELTDALEALLAPEEIKVVTARKERLKAENVPEALARRIGNIDGLIPACGLVALARSTAQPLKSVVRTYFALGEAIGFDWLREQAAVLTPRSHWQRRAVSAIVDDLYSQQTALVPPVLKAAKGGDGDAAVEAWMLARPGEIERTRELMADLRKAQSVDVAMLAVANRQFRSLIVR